jgi:Flp pilus assembly protein TadB
MFQLLQVAGLGALFLALFLGSLALITGGQARSTVARTISTAGQGYRVSGADPRAGGFGGRALAPLLRRAAALTRALTPGGSVAKLTARLDQAGNPPWLTAETVLEYKGVLLILGASTGLLIGVVSTGVGGTLLWTLAVAAAGFLAPNVLLLDLAQRRQQEIRKTLPDILDTLVVTVEAGLGFEAALAQVVRNGRGPMVGEFARVLHEMQIGKPRVEALREMAGRTAVNELRSFSSAVVQATTLGIPMAGVLRQQSAEMRLRRRQRAEEMAQKVPVKILFPMVFCLFPALFVVVLGPGIIKIVEAFSRR